MRCKHNYKLYMNVIDLYYCFDCKDLIAKSLLKEKKIKRLIMPPAYENFTKKRWEELSPWPCLNYDLAKDNYVYFGCIYTKEYIVLPVLRQGNPVFYQARGVNKDVKKQIKYLSASGVKKQHWISQNISSENWFFCEGIADAIYMSQFGSSVGLMGLNYDGSLDNYLKDKKIFLCMDSDRAGIIASIKLWTELKKKKIVKAIYIVPLDENKDPVDYPTEEMKKLINSFDI